MRDTQKDLQDDVERVTQSYEACDEAVAKLRNVSALIVLHYNCGFNMLSQDLANSLQNHFESNNDRFKQLESRWTIQETRIGNVENKLSSLEVAVARLEGSLSARMAPQYTLPPSQLVDHSYAPPWNAPGPRRVLVRGMPEDYHQFQGSHLPVEHFDRSAGPPSEPMQSSFTTTSTSMATQHRPASTPVADVTSTRSAAAAPGPEVPYLDPQAEAQKAAILSSLSKMDAKKFLDMINRGR